MDKKDKKYKIILNIFEAIRGACFGFFTVIAFFSILGKDIHIITDSLLFWIIFGIWLIALFSDRSVRIIWLEERVDKLACENYDRIRDNERLRDRVSYDNTRIGYNSERIENLFKIIKKIKKR